jgi:hypothetical protein
MMSSPHEERRYIVCTDVCTEKLTYNVYHLFFLQTCKSYTAIFSMGTTPSKPNNDDKVFQNKFFVEVNPHPLDDIH